MKERKDKGNRTVRLH